MIGSSNFLTKLLIVLATGGSPLIYYGISPDITTKEQRQFKWLLKWAGEKERELTKEQESNKYSVKESSGNKWQGLHNDEQLNKLLAVKNKQNVYKLFFKKEVIQSEGEIKNSKELKGGITLAKISSGGGKLQIEEITKEEAKKVWLIIARGEGGSIYLMPSVLSKENKEKDIWKEGVSDINKWDNNEQQEELDKKLTQSLKGGFAMVRSGTNIMQGLGAGGRENYETNDVFAYESWFLGKKRGMSFYDMLDSNAQVNIFYNNASIVLGKKEEDRAVSGAGRHGNTSWFISGEAEQWNDKVETFFPLDIQVMGQENKLEETNKNKKKLLQEIKINEKITEVIGVRLDQVVITETGIGRGIEKEIKWGVNINKPIWASELLK